MPPGCTGARTVSRTPSPSGKRKNYAPCGFGAAAGRPEV